jgi:lipid-binding SYLF domain-containing protein
MDKHSIEEEGIMNTIRVLKKNGSKRVAVLLAAIFILGFVGSSRAADDKQEAEQLVEKARFTLEDFMADKNMDAFHDLIKKAKGIYVAPQVLKGAFIVGASGGTGVLLAWDDKQKSWAGPAFDTVGGASFGLQIGGQASEVILVAMTDRGVTSLLANSLKLGADVGLAAGPVGAGVQASSANLSADILSFSRSKGLYGGISLDGAVMAVRGSLNEAYYGKKVDPTDILVRRSVSNPQSAGLIAAVRKATGK